MPPDPVIAALLQERTLSRATMVRFDFASGTMRVWSGYGALETLDGAVWSGLGELGQVSDIEQAVGAIAPPVTLTISGVDTTIAMRALAAPTEVKGRTCCVFDQYFDVETSACVGTPKTSFLGNMDRPKIKATGPGLRTVELTVSSPFDGRRRPAIAYLSSSNQKRAYPGDLGLDQIPALQQADPKWPVY